MEKINSNKANKNPHRVTLIRILFLFLFISFFNVGCVPHWSHFIRPQGETGETIPIPPLCRGEIIIEKGSAITKDCTPSLEMIAENAAYMAFSGDGLNWSNWIAYTEYYDDFNIADGNCGTIMSSGLKTVYVRFQDSEGNIFPDEGEQKIFSSIEYDMQELFSIRITPREAEVKTGGSVYFRVRGYDLFLNEVPLAAQDIEWSKPCGTGTLSNTRGLSTVYTAPGIAGLRNISANYGRLRAGAKVNVIL